MAQTLLQMCQHVANASGIAKPNSIIGNSAETARQMLAAAQDQGESMARASPTGWVDLIRENTFTTVASQAGYTLPSDYKYLIDDTLWDRNNYWEMRGPLNPRQWQIYKSSVLGDTATTRRRWRIANLDGNGKKFYIDPTPPDSGETLVYEYMSTGWCQKSDGTPQSEWLQDTDTIVLDEFIYRLGLKWRILNRLGLDYLEEKLEYEDELANEIGRDTGGDELSLTGPAPISLLTTCNVPDTGYGS